MASFQVTYWRELPSLVAAREGAETVKVSLDPRLQEAIDEAAMRLGDVDSGAYLEGWRRSGWTEGPGSAADLAATEATRLEEEWSPARVTAFLDGLPTAASDQTG